jgi:hypothetical protein
MEGLPSKMKVYAIDVDHTLDCSPQKGPIPLKALTELRAQGHIVGICGNNRVFVKTVPNWQDYVSFLTPFPGHTKDYCLALLKKWIAADEYVMVGNIKGVSGASDDQGAAQKAGWRFIQESAFAGGMR